MRDIEDVISAKIIADSLSEYGARITTIEVVLPKVLLAEFNTHRKFSRNFSSSRAIPTNKFVSYDYFYPTVYGSNKPGMSAGTELSPIRKWLANRVWNLAIKSSVMFSKILSKIGLHKQHSNRVTDWCIMAKGVVTSTEWDHFFKLRDAADAQPEMQVLAQKMKSAMLASTPTLKRVGEWHLPYVEDSSDLTWDKQLQVSVSCCAQVSYRNLDTSLDKAIRLYDMMIESNHLSPFEHQAKVAMSPTIVSGNFNGGWIQFRQMLAVSDPVEIFKRS